MPVVDMTPEVRAKISASLLGRKKSPETRAKMAASKAIGPRDGNPKAWEEFYQHALARTRLLDTLAKSE